METGAAVPYSGNPNLNASREPGHNFKVMKKFILCLLAVAAGMSAFGQGRVMGVRAGLNVTSIDLSAGSNSFSFDSRASYNVGFAYQQPLLRALPLYLETGLYLTGRGGAVNVADFGFGFDEELSGKVKFNMLYLQVPVVVSWHSMSGAFRYSPWRVSSMGSVSMARRSSRARRPTCSSPPTWGMAPRRKRCSNAPTWACASVST